MLIGIIIIVVLVSIPLVALALRMRRGDESAAGGSMGEQLGHSKDDDWGPKPS